VSEQADDWARIYLEGVAVLVWRWRKEASELQLVSSDEKNFAIVGTLRDCADELANSIPAPIVAQAGRET
jgi:hypothetical protein